MTDKDNENTRLIITKHRHYILPVSASMTWQERYPGSKTPKAYKNGKFWQTPDGIVFAETED